MLHPFRRTVSGRPGAPDDIARRLSRLVAQARAADLWERLWRGLIPPLVVAGLFFCVSWLGLWMAVPPTARVVGLVVFALVFVASCFGLRRLAPLDRAGALRRVDKASGFGHRPASALEDTLATAERDPATLALWALHQKRAAAAVPRLRAGAPSPRAVDLDRYAVRFGVMAALFACALIAGPQRYARVAAAFQFGGGTTAPAGSRLDAWLDPPAYTGRPPLLLDLGADASRDPSHPRAISAPIGSVVVVRSSGRDSADVETEGPLLPPAPKPAAKAGQATKAGKAATPGDTAGDGVHADAASVDAGQPADASAHETKLVLHGDSRLSIRQNGRLRGVFALTAIPDLPPTIALRTVPKYNARGTLTLATETHDDYGVSSAEVVFSNPKINGVPAVGPILVEPPKTPLALPGASRGIGDADTTIDLSESPWAGADVTMTLVAKDQGGNVGRSEPFAITLPQKPFFNPVARALVEQRRELVLNSSQRERVEVALRAMMLAPDVFGIAPGVYLGLRYAADTLAQAQSKDQLVAVADYLWGMALQIENGDLSDAEKALRAAEKELRDAIDRNASEREIQKLTDNLQAAMDKFLKELAQQDQKSGPQEQAQNSRQKSISQNDLQKLIDKLKEQAKSGNREEAKKALDQLQDLLDNLKTAKRQKPDPQARAMAQGLNQLDQMMRDQQDLRDQTFKQEQNGQNGDRQADQSGDDGEDMPSQQPGQRQGRGQGQRGQGQMGQGQGQQGQGQQGQGGQGQGGRGGQGQSAEGGKSLEQRQQELRDRLAEVQKRLKQAGAGQGALDEAQAAMREAEDALRNGDGAADRAVDAQGRALESLRQGAKKLADAMQQGEGKGGQGSSSQEGAQGSSEGEQSEAEDPLGRPRGGSRTLESNSRFDPLGVPAAQRAQRVLEELRRRLADPRRNQEEIDYLERLLHSY